MRNYKFRTAGASIYKSISMAFLNEYQIEFKDDYLFEWMD